MHGLKKTDWYYIGQFNILYNYYSVEKVHMQCEKLISLVARFHIQCW